MGMQITGYTDRWAFRPGETVEVRVSSRYRRYAARLIRHVGPIEALEQWDTNVVPVDGVELSSTNGTDRTIKCGSSAYASFDAPLILGGLDIEVWPAVEGEMQLVSFECTNRTVSIGLTADMCLSVDGHALPLVLEARKWTRLNLRFLNGTAEVKATSLFDRRQQSAVTAFQDLGCLAALRLATAFEGRLAHPELLDDRLRPAAAWDFGNPLRRGAHLPPEIRGAPHLELVNAPMLLVGSSDGRPAAASFHLNDLADAAWPVDFKFVLPTDLPSGVYGILLTEVTGFDPSQRDRFDILPLFVVPTARSARVALVMPTFSYRAYANSTFFEEADPNVFRRKARSWSQPLHETALAHGLKSLYDVHTGGDGVALVTLKRPQMTARADYISLLQGFPHQLAADMSIIGWLQLTGQDYDILTDEILHAEGGAGLACYDVVITGSHPEYASPESLSAYAHYAASGGSMMYLGGNGFYWSIGVDPHDPAVIEVRRRDGVRTWTGRAGEHIHQTDGAEGGLWRNLGHPPNVLFGIGFCAHGYSGDGAYMVAEGFSSEEVTPRLWEALADLGGTPFGIAGLELDCSNPELGLPGRSIVLARATGLPNGYVPAIEEFGALDAFLPDPGTALLAAVRGDIVLCDLPGGGKVFSTGSIRWCSGLCDPADAAHVRKLTGAALDDLIEHADQRRAAS